MHMYNIWVLLKFYQHYSSYTPPSFSFLITRYATDEACIFSILNQLWFILEENKLVQYGVSICKFTSSQRSNISPFWSRSGTGIRHWKSKALAIPTAQTLQRYLEFKIKYFKTLRTDCLSVFTDYFSVLCSQI